MLRTIAEHRCKNSRHQLIGFYALFDGMASEILATYGSGARYTEHRLTESSTTDIHADCGRPGRPGRAGSHATASQSSWCCYVQQPGPMLLQCMAKTDLARYSLVHGSPDACIES